jgi:hypothetical protein
MRILPFRGTSAANFMRLSIPITAFAVSLLLLSSAILSTPLNVYRAHSANNTPTQISSERRQAEAAIEQLKRGERPDEVWRLLRHSANPTVRSYLINSFARLQVDPQLLVTQLKIERDTSTRRALILGLGGYVEQSVASAEFPRLIAMFQRW